MNKRKLGNSGLELAPLALGGNVFGWTIDQKTAFDVLDTFAEAGFNFIDTADVYSRWKSGNAGGESETILGNWLKLRGNRDQVLIATKVGSDMGQGGKCLKKSYIRQAVEDSLRRLQTDYLDLYQSHYDDLETPVDETLEAYAELVKSGKVRVIGASNFSQERLQESLETSKKNGWPRYESLQPEYNLYAREHFETSLQPLCQEQNIGVIPYYGLAGGFLTGKYRSEADLGKSARGGGAAKYLNDRGFRILKGLDEVAANHNATPAQISLAWLMHQPTIVAPIASASSAKQLEEILKATELVLTTEDLEKLDRASAYEMKNGI